MYKIFLLLSLFLCNLNAYESEDKLKVIIIGKISKFISWENNTQDDFVITVLNDPFKNLFKKIYAKKKIKSKNVKIVYIDSIDDLKFTNILYIPSSELSNLQNILQKTKTKNILTVSDIRGFAEKKGSVQIYFVSQKIKLKINFDTTKRDGLKIKSTLLNIATVIQEG